MSVINSAIIIVQSSAQLHVIRQKLESNDLVVENAHSVDPENDDDFFRVNGFHNNDDSSEEEGGEGSDNSEDGDSVVTNYVIKLPTLDALSAVVLLNSDIEGVDTYRADFAYMEQILGYKLKNGVRKLKLFDAGNRFRVCFGKKPGTSYQYVAIGRTPFQTEEDDWNKAVGGMLAIRSVYTDQQLNGVNFTVTAEDLWGILNGIPSEFYHRYEGYSGSDWTFYRKFHNTPGFDAQELLANARQSMSSTAVVDTNTISTFHSAYNSTSQQLLELFDTGSLKQDADNVWDSLLRPNELGVNSVTVAKKSYATKIGLNNNVTGLLDLLSLEDYAVVTNSFSPAKDAAIYNAGTAGGNSHLHDYVSTWSMKSLAIDSLIDACASINMWHHSPVSDRIVEILDDGESGDLYLINRIEGQQRYRASIISRDDITNECYGSGAISGQIHKVYKNKKLRAQAAAADTDSASGDDEDVDAAVEADDNNDEATRQGGSQASAADTGGAGIEDEEEEEEDVDEDVLLEEDDDDSNAEFVQAAIVPPQPQQQPQRTRRQTQRYSVSGLADLDSDDEVLHQTY